MITILDFALACVGAYALITGRLPDKGFSIAFGRGDYGTSPGAARLFGIWLLLPLALLFIPESLLASFIGRLWASFFDIFVFIVVTVVAISWARRIRSANGKNSEVKPERVVQMPQTTVTRRAPLMNTDQVDVSPLLNEDLMRSNRRKSKAPQPPDFDRPV
jgi:hypothetical protein